MKKLILFVCILCSFAVSNSFGKDWTVDFYSRGYNFNFVYETETNGTYTCNLEGTGVLKCFTKGIGTFELIEIIDNFTVKMRTTTFSKADVLKNNEISIVVISIVDLMNGTVKPIEQTMEYKIGKKIFNPVEFQQIGNFVGRDFNTMLTMTTGSFDKFKRGGSCYCNEHSKHCAKHYEKHNGKHCGKHCGT